MLEDGCFPDNYVCSHKCQGYLLFVLKGNRLLPRSRDEQGRAGTSRDEQGRVVVLNLCNQGLFACRCNCHVSHLLVPKQKITEWIDLLQDFFSISHFCLTDVCFLRRVGICGRWDFEARIDSLKSWTLSCCCCCGDKWRSGVTSCRCSHVSSRHSSDIWGSL